MWQCGFGDSFPRPVQFRPPHYVCEQRKTVLRKQPSPLSAANPPSDRDHGPDQWRARTTQDSHGSAATRSTGTGQRVEIHLRRVRRIAQVACGRDHSVALDSDGRAWLWGTDLRCLGLQQPASVLRRKQSGSDGGSGRRRTSHGSDDGWAQTSGGRCPGGAKRSWYGPYLQMDLLQAGVRLVHADGGTSFTVVASGRGHAYSFGSEPGSHLGRPSTYVCIVESSYYHSQLRVQCPLMPSCSPMCCWCA